MIESGTADARLFAFAPFGAPALTAEADDAALGDAYADGVEAGRAQRDAEVADLHAQVERLEAALAEASAATDTAAFVAEATDRLVAAWAEAVRAREPEMTALALDVAEAVLSAPPTAEQRVATASAIAQAIDALAEGAPITVALHPVDLLHLQEAGLADSVTAAHSQLRWEPDAGLAEGDWTVATPEAAVHRLRAPMVAAVRERLGLPASS